MGIAYTEDEMKKNFKFNNSDYLYKKNFINYRGNVNGQNRTYSDLTSEWLLNHFDDFDKSIKITHRGDSSYNQKHNGKSNIELRKKAGLMGKYNEKNFAVGLFNKYKDTVIQKNIGCIKDYECPLKNEETDKSGDIDLIAIDENNILSLIELKIKAKQEQDTLLRSVLEIYTYFKIFHDNQKKFLKDFNLNNVTQFKKIILTEKKSLSWKNAVGIDNQTYLKKLIDKLGIEIYQFKYDYTGEPFSFTEKEENKNGEIAKIELNGVVNNIDPIYPM